MFRRLDQSTAIAKLLETISSAMTRRRGLPVILGIVLVIVSFIVQAVNVFVGDPVLELIGVIALHVGLLMALIGLLMAEALGG